ncbi:U-box domain-containing protein 20 [Diplonema papillatum]|nr:U-box domain-containing protein 20 [Diplonema papillatum]
MYSAVCTHGLLSLALFAGSASASWWDRITLPPSPAPTPVPPSTPPTISPAIAAIPVSVLLVGLALGCYIARWLRRTREERQEAAAAAAVAREPAALPRKQKRSLPPFQSPANPLGDVSEAPDHFYCPITQEVMWRPTLCVDGCHSFERGHIERYFDCGYRCCPISRAAMTKGDLHPNDALRAEIRAWVVDNVPGGRALVGEGEGTTPRDASSSLSSSDDSQQDAASSPKPDVVVITMPEQAPPLTDELNVPY